MTPGSPQDELRPVTFDDLDGWRDDDHQAAFAVFRRGAAVLSDHPPKSRALGVDADRLAAHLKAAADLPTTLTDAAARAFFEARFQPVEVSDGEAAHFTGYYEPVVAGSRERTADFQVPLHRRPDDLIEIEPGTGGAGLEPDMRFARATPGGLAPYDDRGAIMAGALDGRGLELCYLADPVDAFFIHIQGAARVDLGGGEAMRVTYAAKSGHAYTPIGRVLIERGALPAGSVTMQSIRAWLADHPDERDDVLAQNRSYIFFREAPVDDPGLGPVAAAKVPLTDGRSLAVDRLLHTFHAPVWIETQVPGGATFNRLMIAQDTGSAIVGPARGDIFFGSGGAAGEIAGAMNARGRFVLLMPKGDVP